MILAIADWKEEAPVTFVCCDALENFFVLSVSKTKLADVATTVVPAETILHIRDPILNEISRNTLDGQQLGYSCVHVIDPDNVSIAGGGPLCVPASEKTEEPSLP